ncbi:plant cadmium resistance 6-like protein [Tanacetum coccineum]
MGRVNGYSTVTENEKPNNRPEPSQQSTPLQPLVQASEPQLHPYVEYSEPQPQPAQPQPQQHGVTTAPAQAQPQIYIQPQIIIQPQIQVSEPVTYGQPTQVGSGYHTYPVQEFHHQPQQVMAPPQQYQQGWYTGLFDCLDDPENAIITLCCPCVTFGQVAEMLDNGGTSCETAGCIYTVIALVIACPCIYSCTYRTKLRGRFGLDESPASDCVTHLCCEYCALCQEYRELNYRGLNPSAGMPF